jgi:uncharacterized LabA/DUF88 family protein
MAIAPAITPKRLMIFADGENLVCRYQAILKGGRTPRKEVRHVQDSYVWCPLFMPRGSYAASRAIYYTSVQGDLAKVRATADELRELRLFPNHAPDWAHERTLYPKVFARPRGREEAKGIDVQLAVDVLSNVYQDNCDAVLLMAGDGDYAPILDESIRRGKITLVAAFSDGLSESVRERADTFYTLDDYYCEEVSSVAKR